MNPSELRVGNWYLSTKFKTPVKCTLSDLVEIYHLADGAEADESHVEQMFEPLPLTDQLLKDFKFIWNEETGLWFFRNGRKSIGIGFVADVICVYAQFDIGLPWVEIDSNGEYEFTHQIQDLCLTLIGKELTK